MRLIEAVQACKANLKNKVNVFSVVLDRTASVEDAQTIISACFNNSNAVGEGDYIYYSLANIEYKCNGNTIVFAITYYCTKEEEEAATALIPAILDGSADAYGATKKIYEWCGTNTVYDSSTRTIVRYHTDGSTDNMQIARNSIWDVFVSRKAVCQGFAEALLYALQTISIKSRIVQGHEVNKSKLFLTHAWNLVAINGLYYNVCITSYVHYKNSEMPGSEYAWLLKNDGDFLNNEIKYVRLPRFCIQKFNENQPMTEVSYPVS